MNRETLPIDAIIPYQFGMCECGRPAGRYVDLGDTLWGVCNDCKIKWDLPTGLLPMLMEMYKVTTFGAGEGYREIPWHVPKWVREMLTREAEHEIEEMDEPE